MNRAMRAIYGVGEFNEYKVVNGQFEKKSVVGRPRKVEDAEAWLQGYLESGKKRAREVLAAGRQAGFSIKTLQRAKNKIQATSIRENDPRFPLHGLWWWSLSPDEGKEL